MSPRTESTVIWSNDDLTLRDGVMAIESGDWDPIRHKDRGIIGFADPSCANDVLSVYNLVCDGVPSLNIGDVGDPLGLYDDLRDFVASLATALEHPGETP